MTPLIQLWIASSAGATIFCSVGFLLARAMDRAEQGMVEAYLTRLRAELEHAQAAYATQGREVEHLEHRAQRAEQSASELSEALALARGECVRLDKELAGRALNSERSSLVELENRRLQELAQASAHWQARAQELEASAKRTEAAEDQCAALSLELERLRKEQHESAGRVQSLSTRAARLDAQEKDNAQLKKQCEIMSNQLHRLRQSQTDASGLGHSVPALSVHTVSRSAEPVSSTEQGLEAILLRQLSLLMLREQDVTAVLSDAHGLPLVGLGPARDQERVSVLTSIARALGSRTRELVGFEQVESLEIVEGGGRTLRVRFFDWMAQPLALGYLGAGRLLQSEAEERMISSFSPLRVVRSA
jgi:chromosome segregation ATPase